MKIDVTQLGWLLLMLWIIQLCLYLVRLVFPNRFNIGIRKIFYISASISILLSLAIMFGGYYKNIPGATCGTESFNPFMIVGLLGSFGSLIFYIFFAILNNIVNRIRNESRS